MGGASGRAAPRGVVLEGSRDSSADVSYRFYPDNESNNNQQGRVGAYYGASSPIARGATPNCKRGNPIARGATLIGRGATPSAGEWKFPALSPDALSGFAKNCPDHKDRDREVSEQGETRVEYM